MLQNIYIYTTSGAHAGFLRGGGVPTLKFLGFWIYMPRSCEPLLWGFGGMFPPPPPKKVFKNGAILCVLRAIFNHFHGKKAAKKIINKHEFFH